MNELLDLSEDNNSNLLSISTNLDNHQDLEKNFEKTKSNFIYLFF